MTARPALAVVALLLVVAAPPAAAQATPSPTAAPPAATTAAASGDKGLIAWYGRKFAGRPTASGERFDPDAMTMAHRTLPFGTLVEVTNLANGRKVKLRVNDRGPTQPDRVGDVSLAAAKSLGMVRSGVVEANLVVVGSPAAKSKATAAGGKPL